MTWLAWRQFRTSAIVAGVAFVAAAAVLLVTRGHVASASDPESLSPTYRQLRLLGTGLIGVPAFIGAFWGAPLVARELEAGTHRFAWTQSVSRGRWLLTKLSVAALASVVLTGALSALFTWWSLPFDRLGGRIGTANFAQRGIAPVAYTLFALALGTLLGIIMKRTVPGIAATLIGFITVRFMFQLAIRPHLVHATTVRVPSLVFGSAETDSATKGAWILSSRQVDAAGHPITNGIDNMLASACHLTRASTTADFENCAHRLGIHDVARIVPANRFWALQAWEAAIFVALALGLASAAWWLLRRRTT